MPATAAEVLRRLGGRGETLAVVESLTGGLLAAEFVAVPGASTVFRGGLVVYATDLKRSLAGVPAELLAARGPVDPAVAAALARGGRRRCGADWALATTGVAGPGAQDGVAAGTAYVAVAGPPVALAGPVAAGERADLRGDGQVWTRELRISGDRATVRAAAVTAAVALLAAHC
ncbi:CinA family protein [Natronosporangium hydrolyticum]|uniref:CinA family protein n=1 Tax=Natronosporangium hydrolyticum TaxID=2811111 RepID=A0A895YFY7_9ACTN|nr:CinA family protein [Natronosporangium hydrolyticum]QSB13456.1 CinA family protein [Natronosporangium hydrolyticum]